MRADRVVVSPPGFDQYFGFGEAVEDLTVEQLVTQRPVEAFVVAVLPRRSGRDVKRLHADLSQPFLNCRRDKFAAIIGPDICWRPARDEQVSQGRQHVFVFELPRHDQGEAFAAGLIDDRQDPELATIMGASLDEVVCPDVPRILRPQPDTRAIVQP